MKSFLSDNCSGILSDVLNAIADVNKEHSLPYGADELTLKLEEKVKELFCCDLLKVFPVCSGTAANIVALASVLHSYEGVICADSAHINTFECGSLEALTGAKILPSPNQNGKLNASLSEKYLEQLGDEHCVQPRIVSISQTTEFGTVYTLDELRNISEFAHKNDLLLHVDGARLSNALVALNSTLEDMVTKSGVDLLSFGGTKNGLLAGDLIISFNEKASKKMRFVRKQFGHLLSKMRFVSAQFLAYLKDDLYMKTAGQSNCMAKYFELKLKEFGFVDIIYPVDSNMLFVKLPVSITNDLAGKYSFHIFDTKNNVARFVTAFDTSKKDIDDFINEISLLSKQKKIR